MAFLWSSLIKDLQRRIRDPIALVLWLGIPFVILTILLLAFGGGGAKPQARLLVADLDDSFLSGAVSTAFGQGPMADIVIVEAVELEEGREKIGEGEGSALLVIPEGFGDAVLSGGSSVLTLTTNPAQNILPGILEGTLEILVDGVFYARRILGDEIDTVGAFFDSGSGPSNIAISQLSVQLNETVTRITEYLTPEPVIALETEIVEDEALANLNVGGLIFQGMFFMAIVFIAQGVSDDVWQERSQGTLRRLVTTPQAIWSFLGGKYLSVAVIVAAAALLILPIGAWLYDFVWSRLPVAVVWMAFSALLLTALFTVIQLLATSQRGGSILSNIILFPMIMIGGNFFPFEAMPEQLANIGRRTPNGWALEQLKAILNGSASAESIGIAFLALSAMGAAAFLFSCWRIRRGFAQAV